MTRRISKRYLFYVLASISVLAIPDLQGQMNKRNPSTAQRARNLLTIQSAKPNPANLEAGGQAVTVTISGTSLGLITAIQVVTKGDVSTSFEVAMGSGSGSSRSFDLKAKADAPAGRYQLRIIASTQRVDLPESVASVEVQVGSAVRTTSRQKAAPAASSPAAKIGARAGAAVNPKPPTRRLYSSDFQSVVSGVFSGAYLRAESCGGRDVNRKTTINVPNSYFREEPLARLDYALTEQEKKDSQAALKTPDGYDDWRASKIRACVDDLRSRPWEGSIEQGRFKVSLTFQSLMIILTREIKEVKGLLGIGWNDDPNDWSDPRADEHCPNYRISGTIVILLTPVTDSAHLSYGDVDVRWSFYRELTGWTNLYGVRDPLIASKVLAYKDSVLEILRQRTLALFSDGQVRARVSEALTRIVKSGEFADRAIAEVTGADEKIVVTFK